MKSIGSTFRRLARGRALTREESDAQALDRHIEERRKERRWEEIDWLNAETEKTFLERLGYHTRGNNRRGGRPASPSPQPYPNPNICKEK